MNARPITWPTVPKGKDRVRVCLHAENTRAEVDELVNAVLAWAKDITAKEQESGRMNRREIRVKRAERVLEESKL